MRPISHFRALYRRLRAAWRHTPVPALYAPEPVVLDARTLRAQQTRDKAMSRLSGAVILILAATAAFWGYQAGQAQNQALAATQALHKAQEQLAAAAAQPSLDPQASAALELSATRLQAAESRAERLTRRLAAAERRTIAYRVLLANRNTPPDLVETIAGTIQEASNRFGVRVDTIIRIATIESHFRPNVVSSKGAHGIMGIRELWINEITWLENVADLKDPVKNINAGAHIYAKHLRQCDGDQDCALAKYNGVEDKPEAFARYKAKFHEVQA